MVFCNPAGWKFYFPRHPTLIAVVGLQARGQTYADFTLGAASLDKPHFGIVHNIRAILTAQSLDPVAAGGTMGGQAMWAEIEWLRGVVQGVSRGWHRCWSRLSFKKIKPN